MIPVVNNRFETPAVVYRNVHGTPRFRRWQTQAQYRDNFHVYEKGQKNRRQTKRMYRAFGSRIEDVPGPLLKLLTFFLFVSYATGRRFQPVETSQRALAVAVGFIGCRAKRRVKAMLDQLIALGFIRVLREPQGCRPGLYLPVTHHDQPPPATVAINVKRPQRKKPDKRKKPLGKVPTAPGDKKICGHSTKKATRGGAKENGSIKKGTTCKRSPVSVPPKGGFEQYLPRHVAESLGYDSAPPQSTEHDQEPATVAGLETAPDEQQPRQLPPTPSPSMQPNAPTEGTETAAEPTQAGPDSPVPSGEVDSAPAPQPALDPVLAAAQAKLLEHRRCQDWRDRKAARYAAKMPADRLRGNYSVLVHDDADGNENRRYINRKGGGKPTALDTIADNIFANQADWKGEAN